MSPSQIRHPLAIALPDVGFPVTICVLAYGANLRIAERFLSSLYHFTDPRLFYLRAGLNAVEPASCKLFQKYASRFGNVSTFKSRRNIFKSPMMRRMFYEPPLTTAWTIWCDDDTHFLRHDWLPRLGLKIEQSLDVCLWGRPYALWMTEASIVDWIKKASWYRGRRCVRARDPQGRLATKFRFATGGFWAARTEVLKRLNWPDHRLLQANDDFLLGEAMRQNGMAMGRFDYGVRINDAPRRNWKAPEVQSIDFQTG